MKCNEPRKSPWPYNTLYKKVVHGTENNNNNNNNKTWTCSLTNELERTAFNSLLFIFSRDEQQKGKRRSYRNFNLIILIIIYLQLIITVTFIHKILRVTLDE